MHFSIGILEVEAGRQRGVIGERELWIGWLPIACWQPAGDGWSIRIRSRSSHPCHPCHPCHYLIATLTTSSLISLISLFFDYSSDQVSSISFTLDSFMNDFFSLV